MARRLAVAAATGTLLLAACGSGDDPTLDTSAAPNDTAADMPGMEQGEGDSAATTCEPAGTSLSIVAEGTKWNADCLAAPAGQAFTIVMDNKDTVAHNVAILKSHSATDVQFRGELLQGPKQTTYEIPALSAGTYVFHCEVHPTQMRGTFVVS